MEYFAFGIVQSVLSSRNYVNDRLNKRKKKTKTNIPVASITNYPSSSHNIQKSHNKL